jgi:RHS repeat-associated protein
MSMTVRYTTIDGEIVSENRGGVLRDYVPDSLGSTVALLDNTQTQTDTFSYWPYGEIRTRTGATATPLQFVGTQGYYQDSTSRTYVRTRHLDTAKGRWFSTDPIGFDSGDVNLYRYVQNSPTTSMDPSGLDPCQGIPPPPIRRLFPPPSIRRFFPPPSVGPLKKQWHCTTRCNCTGNPACSNQYTGGATGKDQGKTCTAAKKDAGSKCQSPCTTGHCDPCTCNYR